MSRYPSVPEVLRNEVVLAYGGCFGCVAGQSPGQDVALCAPCHRFSCAGESRQPGNLNLNKRVIWEISI